MRIYPDQLAKQIAPLKPCYMVFGDDPWQCETVKAVIYAQAKKEGFEEKIHLTQETGFNWNDLIEECNTMSLFASRRIIELNLPQAKPGAEGSTQLQAVMQSVNPDILLVITGPKLASEQTKSKWFKTLDNHGIYIPCTTPEGAQFQRWLNTRIQHFNLNLTQDAQQMLFSLYEGNLLAADQALQLLQLLSPNQQISSQQLALYFEDQSRFTVFQLADVLLSNQQEKAQHILSQLQAEGIAMPILLWGQFKELTTLFELKRAQEMGENVQTMWSKLRIWDKRKALYQAALTRLSLRQIETMLAFASKTELRLKQQGIEDWTALSHLCLLYDPAAHQHLNHIELE
ncbi:DNA polymerase III subunit delta [Shewanella psychrotolerans]|uniref:DNA polymerase III subunit delta n=1 Tax=Shewanella psychrotolerans TaxID=2864206 RepID=UPI001C65E79D|nr:DNA polymerase III subunit delta [Shewanella psychrotolerans]QYK02309.1 DNA polymerase III subunit delta [Shewanella psychrotolerans]